MLKTTQQNLTTSISTLETQQQDYSQKQDAYQSQKSESDKLLKQLDEQKQTFSEYRNQDQAELNAVNAEIAKAAEAYKKKLEAEKKKTTTTKATTTTTKKSDEGSNDGETSTTKHTTTAQEDNSGRLRMTYPVPSQTRITCGYHGYAGHTGVDFSCAANSKVVAAESGIVIISKDLTNSDGTYRSYGRYIVIMHDKTDSAGNYVYTLYAHNNSRLVRAGQEVKKGQQIAWSGSTGNSTGPHCHFEVRTPSANYNDCVNPTFYLP